MIAGFCELDSGEIRFGDERIDRLPAHVRDIGMVFQNYAVFPNLTVAGNVAYGLKARKRGGAEIAAPGRGGAGAGPARGLRRALAAPALGRPAAARRIARALVIRPQVLLFDEPLSNLDARLRVSMRAEIRELQKSLGITAIYVTHDQEEAMSVSDRIALMNAGRLEQVGVPVDIYRHPVSRFAAEFMGTTNLVEARAARPRRRPLVSLRPEALRFAADAPRRLAAPVRNGGRASSCWGRSCASTCAWPTARSSRPATARCAGVPGAGRRRGDARLRSGAADGAAVTLAIPLSAAPAARHRGAGLALPRRLPALSAVQRVRRQPARCRGRAASPSPTTPRCWAGRSIAPPS